MTEPQPGDAPGIKACHRRTQACSFPRHRPTRTWPQKPGVVGLVPR